MAEKDFVDEWTARIKAGMEYREKYSTYKRWKDYRKMYRGDWQDPVVPVNKVYSYGRALIPRVYFRSPRVCVTAIHPSMEWHAKVVEAIDNMLIRETFLKRTLKKAVLDAYLCGVGPIKLGYDSEFGYIPDLAFGEDGQTVTQIGRKEGSRIEYRQGVKPGMPWALRVMPEDVVVPWGATDSDSLSWVAHYILRPLEDVKQDQKYRHVDKLKGTRTPDMTMLKRMEFRPRESKDKDVVYAELWEIRDYKSGQLITICEDQVLLAIEDPLQVEGLPWEFLQFNDDPEFFWSIPDAAILEPSQVDLNDVRTQRARHRMIALLKFLYQEKAITPDQLENFFSGVPGIGVAVKGENLANAVLPLQPHVPPDLYTEEQAILREMEDEMGMGPNQMGMLKPGTPPTASEVGLVESAFNVRVDERRDIVADVLINIIRKWNQFIFQFWTEKRVVQVVNPQGTPFWVEYTGDQLKGEYFLAIDPESGMPLSRMLKYQMAKDLFSLLNGDPLVDQILLRQLLLRHYSTVEPLVENLISSPPGVQPMEAAMLRQPHPIGAAGEGGRQRSRGMSPQTPLAFEEAKERFGLS